MSNEKEILYLLCKGELSVEAIDQSVLPLYCVNAIRAIKYCNERGDSPPLSAKKVWKVASTRYGANEETQALLRAVHEAKYDKPILESVRDSLTLKAVLQATTNQLANGEYSLESIRSLLNTSSSTSALIKRVSAPDTEKDRYLITTGITRLDSAIEGVGSELVIVAGRPKAGKTTFLAHVVINNDDKRVLYISVADYDYADLCSVFQSLNAESVGRDNLYISDFTGFSANLTDVESVVRKVEPEILIVDRAEKLTPLRKHKEIRTEVGATFDGLRRIAKRYSIPVFTDSQIGFEGEQEFRKRRQVDFSFLAEDKTNRAAVLDLFIGLMRQGSTLYMSVHGRRHGLPKLVEQPTSKIGKYYE